MVGRIRSIGSAPMILDSHIHLWNDTTTEAAWLASERTRRIRRPFLLRDLAETLGGTDVGSVVVVTAREAAAENGWLLEETDGSPLVEGVVGWVDLTRPVAVAALDGLLGVRTSLLGVDPDWLDRRDVRAGVAQIAAAGLTVEFLAGPRHLSAIARCASTLDGARVVVDHLGHPPVGGRERRTWENGMAALAKHDNVSVKASGARGDSSDLAFVFDRLGSRRVMFGSDWPVSLLASTYGEVLQRVRDDLAGLSSVEQENVFGRNARRAYGRPS